MEKTMKKILYTKKEEESLVEIVKIPESIFIWRNILFFSNVNIWIKRTTIMCVIALQSLPYNRVT